MEMKFEGKSVIITGAGSGLGREYAHEFAKRGADVVVNDLGSSLDGSGASSSAADTVVSEIKASGGRAVANYDNVATEEGGKNIIAAAMDSFGRVDVLVNNAGILRDRSMVKMSPEEWDMVTSVHLRGAFCVTQPALEVMRKQSYGKIIVTTSTAGLFGNFGQSNYASAKLGLVGMMNVIKLENSKYNICVNAVAPTAASRMTEGVIPPAIAEKLHPSTNVPMVVYLCHEDCAENGSIFVMGGGWFARAAIVCGDGAIIGDVDKGISAEDVRDNFSKISDIEGAKPVSSAVDVFQKMAPLFS